MNEAMPQGNRPSGLYVGSGTKYAAINDPWTGYFGSDGRVNCPNELATDRVMFLVDPT